MLGRRKVAQLSLRVSSPFVSTSRSKVQPHLLSYRWCSAVEAPEGKAPERIFSNESDEEKKEESPWENDMKIFNALGDGNFSVALANFQALKKDVVGITDAPCDALIRVSFKDGQIATARRIFEEMQVCHINPTHRTVYTMMKGFREARLYEDVLRIFKGMDMLELTADARIMALLVDTYLDMGKPDEAINILKNTDFEEGNNGLLLSAMAFRESLANKNGKAVALLNQMFDLKVRPSTTLLHRIIRGLCYENQIKVSMQIIKKMQQQRYNVDHFPFLLMCNALCKEKKFEKANQIVKRMKDFDVLPSVVMLDGFVREYAMNKAHIEVIELAEIIKEYGLLPKLKAQSYSNILQSAAQSKNAAFAFPFWDLVKGMGCKPDMRLFSSLIELCKGKGDATKGLAIAEEMSIYGATPDIFCFGKLLSFSSDVETSFRILESMQLLGVTPDSHCFTSVITLCCKKGNLTEVPFIVKQMEQLQVKIDQRLSSYLAQRNFLKE